MAATRAERGGQYTRDDDYAAKRVRLVVYRGRGGQGLAHLYLLLLM